MSFVMAEAVVADHATLIAGQIRPDDLVGVDFQDPVAMPVS